MAKVIVIIPEYNVGLYLPETLEGILARIVQRYSVCYIGKVLAFYPITPNSMNPNQDKMLNPGCLLSIKFAYQMQQHPHSDIVPW